MTALQSDLVALDTLGESFAGLRVITDDALRRMQRSLTRHGQLTAVATCAMAGGLEIVDGFKRLRAARALRLGELRVRVVAETAVHAKVAMRVLNEAHGLSELEEAWLCRSLYREDKLTQPEIGRLLDRHKSWVCRRLAMAEALDDSVQADVRLGLVGASAAQAIARLPRGNQRAVADLAVRRGLTFGQTERLVAALLRDPAADPEALVVTAPSPTSTPPRERTALEWILADVGAVTRLSARLQARLLEPMPPTTLVTDALRGLAPVLAALQRRMRHLTGEEDADLDHPRGARPPDGDPVSPGHDPPRDRPRPRGQPQHDSQDSRRASDQA